MSATHTANNANSKQAQPRSRTKTKLNFSTTEVKVKNPKSQAAFFRIRNETGTRIRFWSVEDSNDESGGGTADLEGKKDNFRPTSFGRTKRAKAKVVMPNRERVLELQQYMTGVHGQVIRGTTGKLASLNTTSTPQMANKKFKHLYFLVLFMYVLILYYILYFRLCTMVTESEFRSPAISLQVPV